MREGGYFNFLSCSFRHPELGVLMCTKCYKCYGRGGWTKDGEGNDEYCRFSMQYFIAFYQSQVPLMEIAYLFHIRIQVVLRRGADLPLRLLPAGTDRVF